MSILQKDLEERCLMLLEILQGTRPKELELLITEARAEIAHAENLGAKAMIIPLQELITGCEILLQACNSVQERMLSREERSLALFAAATQLRQYDEGRFEP